MGQVYVLAILFRSPLTKFVIYKNVCLSKNAFLTTTVNYYSRSYFCFTNDILKCTVHQLEPFMFLFNGFSPKLMLKFFYPWQLQSSLFY